jgi:hypothetical protein
MHHKEELIEMHGLVDEALLRWVIAGQRTQSWWPTRPARCAKPSASWRVTRCCSSHP